MSQDPGLAAVAAVLAPYNIEGLAGDVLAALDDIAWSSRRGTAAIVRELVTLAHEQEGMSPEWLSLIKDVHEGRYTPPEERQR